MLRGYQNYRGRRSAAIKLLIAVLVVILVVACAFLFVQRFVTYTDDGTLRLDLPGFVDGIVLRQEKPSTPPAAQDSEDANGGKTDAGNTQDTDINLIIDGPDEEDPPEDPPAVERHLLQMPTLPADGGVLKETLAASGANGFVWQVRDNTGAIHYSSAAGLQDAVKGEISMEALTALCAVDGVTSVARFNCFHDSYYAFVNMASAAICQNNGYVWYDNLSYHWLDPAKEQARSYVTIMALECAQMGFDELLLEELAYPTAGKLQKINYSGNTLGKTEALVQFMTELKAVLEPYNVRLSLLLSEDLIVAGNNADSGQDLSVLLPLVDAVYATVADPASAQAQLNALCGGSGPELIPLTAAAQEGQWCIAG